MITVSAVATTLFLGGWRPFSPFSRIGNGLDTGWWPLLWFSLKVMALLFGYIWLRGTLPRMRYDQFMKLGWKVLVPVSLGWVLLVAAASAWQQRYGGTNSNVRYLLFGLAAVLVVVLVWPVSDDSSTDKKKEGASHA
jgi:NADH-quinone oxidoreductase subunit H